MEAVLERFRIEDEELFVDFQNALDDYVPRISQLLGALRHSPQDEVLLADLMRLMHTIKGDAGLCRMGFLAQLMHGVEDLLARVRTKELAFSYAIEQAVFLAIDHLELLIQSLDQQSEVPLDDFNRLCDELKRVARVNPDELDEAIAQLIEVVTGYRPANMHDDDPPVLPVVADALRQDLRLFHELAMQLEQRSHLLQGRTERNLLLARECNELAGLPVDPLQLEAAIYMHDVGMMFLPEDVWFRASRLSEEQRSQLVHHPGWAADILVRMQGWAEAATMVRQHHERLDGRGYPAGLKSEMICSGAKLIAIVDTFEAVILRHGQRMQSRSLLRAVAEVNACESQFDAGWIRCFNSVVHRRIADGSGLPHIR